jgi:hypothetical protein
MNNKQLLEAKKQLQNRLVVVENQIKKQESARISRLANLKEEQSLDLPSFDPSTVNKYASQIISIAKQLDPSIKTPSNSKFRFEDTGLEGTDIADEWRGHIYIAGDYDMNNEVYIYDKKWTSGSDFSNNELTGVTVQGNPVYFSKPHF